MHPVEKAVFKAGGSLVEKQFYAYEFDPAGNWVKRLTSKLTGNSGASEPLPVEVTVREITY
jgi:hypothetical protein